VDPDAEAGLVPKGYLLATLSPRGSPLFLRVKGLLRARGLSVDLFRKPVGELARSTV